MDNMSDGARELKLYIENDGDLYRRQWQPIIKNLTIKVAQGKYDTEKAVKLFMYLMDNGAKQYAKEFATPGEWNKIFSRSDRMEAAREFTADFEHYFKEGYYNEYIPKKYAAKFMR